MIKELIAQGNNKRETYKKLRAQNVSMKEIKALELEVTDFRKAYRSINKKPSIKLMREAAKMEQVGIESELFDKRESKFITPRVSISEHSIYIYGDKLSKAEEEVLVYLTWTGECDDNNDIELKTNAVFYYVISDQYDILKANNQMGRYSVRLVFEDLNEYEEDEKGTLDKVRMIDEDDKLVNERIVKREAHKAIQKEKARHNIKWKFSFDSGSAFVDAMVKRGQEDLLKDLMSKKLEDLVEAEKRFIFDSGRV